MSEYAYVGSMGEMDERVELGTQVGYQEIWCEHCTNPKPGMMCPSYIVVGIVDNGHLITITRILHMGDESGNYVVVNPNVTQDVEPWKLGLI